MVKTGSLPPEESHWPGPTRRCVTVPPIGAVTARRRRPSGSARSGRSARASGRARGACRARPRASPRRCRRSSAAVAAAARACSTSRCEAARALNRLVCRASSRRAWSSVARAFCTASAAESRSPAAPARSVVSISKSGVAGLRPSRRAARWPAPRGRCRGRRPASRGPRSPRCGPRRCVRCGRRGRCTGSMRSARISASDRRNSPGASGSVTVGRRLVQHRRDAGDAVPEHGRGAADQRDRPDARPAGDAGRGGRGPGPRSRRCTVRLGARRSRRRSDDARARQGGRAVLQERGLHRRIPGSRAKGVHAQHTRVKAQHLPWPTATMLRKARIDGYPPWQMHRASGPRDGGGDAIPAILPQ